MLGVGICLAVPILPNPRMQAVAVSLCFRVNSPAAWVCWSASSRALLMLLNAHERVRSVIEGSQRALVRGPASNTDRAAGLSVEGGGGSGLPRIGTPLRFPRKIARRTRTLHQ